MKQETFFKLPTKDYCIPLYPPTDNAAEYVYITLTRQEMSNKAIKH